MPNLLSDFVLDPRTPVGTSVVPGAYGYMGQQTPILAPYFIGGYPVSQPDAETGANALSTVAGTALPPLLRYASKLPAILADMRNRTVNYRMTPPPPPSNVVPGNFPQAASQPPIVDHPDTLGPTSNFAPSNVVQGKFGPQPTLREQYGWPSIPGSSDWFGDTSKPVYDPYSQPAAAAGQPPGMSRPATNVVPFPQPPAAVNDNQTAQWRARKEVESNFPEGSMWSWKTNLQDFASGKGKDNPDRELHFIAMPTGAYNHRSTDNIGVRLFDARNGIEWPKGAGNFVPHSELKPYNYNGQGVMDHPGFANDNPPSQWTGFQPTHWYTSEADDELNPTVVQRTGRKHIPSLGLTEVRLPDGNGTTRMVPIEHLWELPTYDVPTSNPAAYRPGNAGENWLPGLPGNAP